ncbi:hypothetical protein PIB30_095915, partial [Stylosanthes scabra]|nr:hypothetical protein [Stylosanthes scabra]
NPLPRFSPKLTLFLISSTTAVLLLGSSRRRSSSLSYSTSLTHIDAFNHTAFVTSGFVKSDITSAFNLHRHQGVTHQHHLLKTKQSPFFPTA